MIVGVWRSKRHLLERLLVSPEETLNLEDGDCIEIAVETESEYERKEQECKLRHAIDAPVGHGPEPNVVVWELGSLLIVFGGWFIGVVILVVQAVGWLKTGHWSESPLSGIVFPIIAGTPAAKWLSSPDSWYGLHWIVTLLIQLPLWFCIPAISSGIGMFLLRVRQSN